MTFRVYDLLYLHNDNRKVRKIRQVISAYGIPLIRLDFDIEGLNIFKAYLDVTGYAGIPVTPFRMCSPLTGNIITSDPKTYEGIQLDNYEEDTLNYFGSIPIMTSFEYHIIINNISKLIYKDPPRYYRVSQQLSRYYDFVYSSGNRAKNIL